MKKIPIILTTISPLFAAVSVMATQSGNRVFTFRPNPRSEQSVFGRDNPLNARTTAIIVPYFLVTDMMVTPRTLNPKAAKTKSVSIDDRTMQIKLHIPPGVVNGDVPLTTFKLNGQSIDAFNPPTQNRYHISSDFVHIYFDRSDAMSILGPVSGDRVVTLEAKIGGAGLLTARDIIKLLSSK